MQETSKPIATLRARFALAGWRLYIASDEDGERYFATRWGGMVRELADPAAAEAFLQQIAGQRCGLQSVEVGRTPA